MRVGFDIGGTTARGGLVDDETISAIQRTEVRGATDPDAVAECIENLFDELLAARGASAEDIETVGVALAGQLSPDGRTVRNSPNLGWRDVEFASILEGQLGDRSVYLCNDVNASLWGERTAGAVQGARDVLAVYVGTGVGGAVIAEDRLVRGAEGVAGEIGHSKVEVGGRLCGCGERGCVEAYAGGIHLERQIRERVQGDSAAEGLVDADGGVDMDAADSVADEHEIVDQIWREATERLAMVIGNACTLLNPSLLLLGGGVLERGDVYRRRLLSKIPSVVLEAARLELEIRHPELGDEAALFGAADLAERQDGG